MYRLQFYELASPSGTGVTTTFVGEVLQDSRSLVVPEGYFTAGKTYMFLLDSFNDPAKTGVSSPWRQSMPSGYARFVSNTIQP
jgi:hypothetical protein